MFLASSDPAFVETLTAWSTLAAAIATAASVLFIAWQIRLTRKSVEATEATLTIARDEFAHGQMLRTDAQRASIDAEMPRLSVEVSRQSAQAWRTDVTETDPYSGEEVATEVDPGVEFTSPRDDSVPLVVGVEISISNDGPRRARIQIGMQDSSLEVVIKAGDFHRQWVRRVQPLSEWIAIAKFRERGDTEEEHNIASIVYTYPGDVGATEIHSVIQGGSIVEPVSDNAGGWRVRPFQRSSSNTIGSLSAVAMPFTRTYWASRRENRPLISPSGDATEDV